jgi:hypothetical protein
MNKIIRLKFGVIFLSVGIILLSLWIYFQSKILVKFMLYSKEILWCSGWAAFGIGCGLINSRYDDINEGKNDKDKKKNKGGKMHYVLYFSFVWFIAFLAALTMVGANNIKFYAATALVAIVVGFTGDKLAGKIFDLRK